MKIFFLASLLITSFTYAGITDIKFTEIMYNAPDEGGTPGTELEFVELKNTGTTDVDVSNFMIAGGISYSFPNNSILAAGEFAVIVSNSNSFAIRYPSVNVDGEYTGGLRNSGERLYLITGTDTLLNFKYDDNVPWPILADGNGFSMVPTETNPTNNQNDGDEWKSSSTMFGSPGSDDPVGNDFPDVYINECLSNSSGSSSDRVELYNASTNTVDLSYWYFSDDRNKLKQYQFSNGTTIAAGGYLVLDEQDFNPNNAGFSFNRSGDNVYLVSANSAGELTGYAQGWSFLGQYTGVSFGVYTNSENKRHFVAQTSKTMNAVNLYPKIGPLVITDINYNPDITNEEYLIIKNISDSTLNLWHEDVPDSTWGVTGIRFNFPSNTSLSPSESVFLCGTNPTNFRIKYNLDPSDKVFQYSGKISNSGETLAIFALLDADTAGVNNDSIFMPKIIVDQVSYNDKSPWPLSADGQGDRLIRIQNDEYGNDPINWTTGPANVLGVQNVFNEDYNFKIYPQPAYGAIQVDLNYNDGNTYELITTTGRIIRTGSINGSSFVIPKNNLASGVYILRINDLRKKVVFN